MSKNIEKIKGEEALSEIVDITLDDAKLNGLVSNDVSDMYQSASGLRPLKPIDTYESPIVELKANLKLIFRRLFSVPLTILGSNKSSSPISIIKMMEQMFNHYRERLKGSEEYGIPSRLSSLTDLPDAPALLADRKIGGVIGAPDGMSLAQLLCSTSAASSVTEIVDDNIGWTMKKNISGFPSLRRLRLGCAYVLNWPASTYLPTTLTEIEFPELISWGITSEYRPLFIYNNPNITELTFPKCKAIGNGFTYDSNESGCFISLCSNLRVVRFPEMYKYGEPEGGGASYADNYGCLIHSCENLEEMYMPKWTGYRNWRIIRNCPKVWKVVLGNISYGVPALYDSYAYPFDSLVNLYHLEIAGCTVSLNLSSWKPTTALSDNLQQFLQNFRDYIANRLTDNGKGLTLTLSQEVRNAIHAAEATYGIENIIITQKGWTISPAPN